MHANKIEGVVDLRFTSAKYMIKNLNCIIMIHHEKQKVKSIESSILIILGFLIIR